jgi:hypothetical protein
MSFVEVVTSMASILVIACSPYDPDLGDQPFLCGNGDPRCPDGYVCIERVNNDKVCERTGTAADAGGDGNLLCSRDAAFEPNETIETATVASIAADGVAPPVAAVICPDTERDTYRLSVATTGQNIRVEVTYQSSAGQLAVELLNSTGIPIRSATPTGNNPDKLRADFTNVAQGTYYGQVHGARNNYQIGFIVTSDTLPP